MTTIEVLGRTIIVETVPTEEDVIACLNSKLNLFAEWMQEVEYDWDHGGAMVYYSQRYRDYPDYLEYLEWWDETR